MPAAGSLEPAAFIRCCCVLLCRLLQAGGTPVGIFAAGAAKFFGSVGIPVHLGAEFAMLAISTFLLTTLDTCTRLTRFLIEELFSWRNEASRYLGTLLALLLPALLVFQQFPGVDGTLQPAWKAIWPLFGATNQLLAALALLTFVVFLKSHSRSFLFSICFLDFTSMATLASVDTVTLFMTEFKGDTVAPSLSI